jgi:hypothetical protein
VVVNADTAAADKTQTQGKGGEGHSAKNNPRNHRSKSQKIAKSAKSGGKSITYGKGNMARVRNASNDVAQ